MSGTSHASRGGQRRVRQFPPNFSHVQKDLGYSSDKWAKIWYYMPEGQTLPQLVVTASCMRLPSNDGVAIPCRSGGMRAVFTLSSQQRAWLSARFCFAGRPMRRIRQSRRRAMWKRWRRAPCAPFPRTRGRGRPDHALERRPSFGCVCCVTGLAQQRARPLFKEANLVCERSYVSSVAPSSSRS
jgi:hypothetical protein